MTIKQFLGHFNNGYNQVVKITDETKHRTYESDPGTFCFDFYADLFDGDYEKCLEYIYKMRVLDFKTFDNGIWIHAE